jgi:hypothetical protein
VVRTEIVVVNPENSETRLYLRYTGDLSQEWNVLYDRQHLIKGHRLRRSQRRSTLGSSFYKESGQEYGDFHVVGVVVRVLEGVGVVAIGAQEFGEPSRNGGGQRTYTGDQLQIVSSLRTSGKV